MVLLRDTPAAAQTIMINGYADATTFGAMAVVGNDGFTYTQGFDIVDNVSGAYFCNGDPNHCTPGTTMSLRASTSDVSGKATLNGTTYNDVGGLNSLNSIHFLFDGSVVLPPIAPTATVTAPFTFTGTFTYATSTASSVNGWGWQNTAYWVTQATTVSFAASGTHTLRVQVREDGVEFDQIVLSPSQYLNTPPGPSANDFTIVPKS